MPVTATPAPTPVIGLRLGAEASTLEELLARCEAVLAYQRRGQVRAALRRRPTRR